MKKEISKSEKKVDISVRNSNCVAIAIDGSTAIVNVHNFPPIAKPFQAPIYPSHFVGRESETEILIKSLTHGKNASIYGLYGMGGIGKTTLATVVAHRLKDLFYDGILWSRLDINDAYSTLGKFALSFGHDLSNVKSVDQRSSFVRSLLCSKKVLVVLDNVISDDDLKILLPAIGPSRFIVTSRHSGLPSMRNTFSLNLQKLSLDESVELFIKFAKVDKSDLITVNKICLLLDGLPLAIEIAASNVGFYNINVTKYYEMLLVANNKLAELSYENLSVEASFMISWQHLDQEKRYVFTYLSLFRSHLFTTDAIAFILDINKLDLLRELGRLKVLSLIQKFDDERWTLHPLLKDYANSKILDVSEYHNLQIRHRDYYLKFGKSHARDFPVISEYFPDIKSGMEFSKNNQDWATYVNYIEALSFYLLAVADLAYIENLCRISLEGDHLKEHPESQAYILLALGHLDRIQQKFYSAKKYLLSAIKISSDIKNDKTEEQALHELGGLLLTLNDLENAEGYLQRSLEIGLKHEDTIRISKNYHQLGILYLKQGDNIKGVGMLKQSMNLKMDSGDKSGASWSMLAIAQHFIETRSFTEAIEILLKAINIQESIQESIQDFRRVSQTYLVLAETYFRIGKFRSVNKYANLALERAISVADGEIAFESRELLKKTSQIFHLKGGKP